MESKTKKPFQMPFHLKSWIADNHKFLEPPVGNKVIWKDSEFIVMVIGPNNRTDFHINQGEEFFYQLKGDVSVKLMIDGQIEEVQIHEGDVFLLPAGIPHSPQRPPNTIGLVVERQRKLNEKDALVWYCDQCKTELYKEEFEVKDIVKELPLVFDRYYSSEKNTTCKNCSHKHYKA